MKNNQKNIIVSGFGGQGVLFLGTVLSHAAIIEGKNTTWIPSYGAEMRGGSANCYVVISDNEIASPIFDKADLGIFLSKQAIKKFEKLITESGLIVTDSSLEIETNKLKNVEYLFKPFNKTVLEKSKNLLLNIVVLGSVIKKTGILTKENVLEALKKVSSTKKPEFLEINLKSFEFGYNM